MFYDMASWLSHLDRRVAVADHEARVEKGLKLLEAKEAEEAKKKAAPRKRKAPPAQP